MTREIVTVQVGTQSNFVGAHFWNLQDEYLATPLHLRKLSPSVFFHEISPRSSFYRTGLTYAPRLQVIDATGAFGALSTQTGEVLSNPVNHTQLPSPIWHGKQQTFFQDPVKPSAYVHQLQNEETEHQVKQLNNPESKSSNSEHGKPVQSPKRKSEPGESEGDVFSDVTYWSDFLKTRFHPRTCKSIPGVHYDVSNLDYFDSGSQIAAPLVEDFYNDLRFFVEDCDSFGGLIVTSNADDAYAGITTSYISHAVEELGSSASIQVFGVHNAERCINQTTADALQRPFTPAIEKLYSQNESRLVSFCQDSFIQYVPLSSQLARSVPRLHVSKNSFQTSAVMGLALDVALTPLRQNESLANILSILRPVPYATFGNVAINIPHDANNLVYGSSLVETENTVNLSDAWSPALLHSKRPGNPRRIREVISARGFSQDVPVHSSDSLPVAIPIPFPALFDKSFLNRTRKQKSGPSDCGVFMEQISVLAGLATVPESGRKALQCLSDALTNVSHLHRHGIEREQLENIRNDLQNRAEDYDNL